VDDPVLAKRRQVAKLAQLGNRVGYACFGLAIVVFVVGFVTTFSSAIATTTIALLIVGSIVLAPSIVAGYAVKAADREDRDGGASPHH
jgi:sugar phosphate permease